MKQVATLLLVIGLSSAAFGISKAYDVVPFGNCVSEIVTVPNSGITQLYRNTLDSLVTASVWVGDTLSSQPYFVEIRDSAVPTQLIAHGPTYGVHAPQCWAWLDIPLTKDTKPVRGKTQVI
jgi:hypothetical protein